MKMIQTRCIQTILDDHGRFDHYRLTLPVTEKFAQRAEYKNIQCIGKRFWYVRVSNDWDQIQRMLVKAQLMANNLVLNERIARHAQLQQKQILLYATDNTGDMLIRENLKDLQ